MIEETEGNPKDAQEKLETQSSKIRFVEGDSSGGIDASSTSKVPLWPALSSHTDSASHPSHVEILQSTGARLHDRSTVQPGPCQALILQTTYRSETQMTKLNQSNSNTAWHESYSSDSPVLPPHSSELESPQDLEKASLDQRTPCPQHSYFTNAHCTSTTDIEGDDRAEDNDPTRHAMRILIFLSTLAPALSLAICLYTSIVALLILALSPFCLCTTPSQVRRSFQRFLVPPLNLQLKLIYSDFNDEGTSRSSRPLMLVLVNTLAPVYAIGICMATWVAAGFWFFAAILGDPNIKDKSDKGKDDDGKTAVMTVRCWWENWLIRGLR